MAKLRQSNESMRLIITTIIGVVLGFLIGISFPTVNITKLHFPSSIISYVEDSKSGVTTQAILNHAWVSENQNKSTSLTNSTKIYVPTNPRGAERLAPDIIVPESDFYLRRLWGNPKEDLPMKQKYLVTFTVGIDQKHNIDAAVKKFSENFTILLFHYDGRALPLFNISKELEMASKTVESHRAGAEVYHGDAESRKKIVELLGEISMPTGLFPMEDIEEFGYNREAGFIWIIQKKKKNHTFKKIKRQVSYDTEVTALVEDRKMKKMTGIKTKELLLWLSVVEMYFESPSADKLTFKTGTGLSDSFEAAAFELEA